MAGSLRLKNSFGKRGFGTTRLFGVHPNAATKWRQAVERLALRAVAPHRAARGYVRLGPVVTRAARSARAEWSQRDHSHHPMVTPSQFRTRPIIGIIGVLGCFRCFRDSSLTDPSSALASRPICAQTDLM